MKKWLFSILSGLFVALTFAPITAYAAPTESVNIGTATLDASTPYYHNGANGAQGTADNVAADAHASFNADTGTLTLNGLQIETNEKAILWEYNYNGNYDLILELADGTTNTVISTGASAIVGDAGFSDGPSITIQGSGTLNVTGANNGFWVWQNVTIQGDAKVNVVGTSKAGICNNTVAGAITIKDNAVVTATGAIYGIGYDNNRTNTPVIQGGALTVIGGTAAFQSAPDLQNYHYQALVGNSEGAADTWDNATALNSYPYVKLIASGTTHSWATAWSSDADYHWHNCEGAGDCNITDVSQKDGYGTHSYDNDQDATCDTCGYTRTITSGDTIAPFLTGIKTSRTSDSTATVKFASTEAGTYYYKYQHEGAGPVPSASYLKQYGTSASCVSGENSLSLTSLTAGTFEIFFVTEDAAGNVSNVLTLPIFEYSQAAAPVSGTVENATDKATNECNAMLDVSGSDLVGKVLSTEEQQKVADGKDAKIWLEVKAGESKATEEDKTLTQAKLGDYTLGMYLDLTLWKQFDGESAVSVSTTKGAVSVKFAIPQNLINTDANKTRAYEIIRIHNDGTGAKADILPCSFDAATKEITFETDRFSIYSLAYKDTVNTPTDGDNENNGGGNTGENDSNDGVGAGGENKPAEDNGVDDTEADNEEDTPATTETKQKDNVPKTGDNNSVSAWFLIALVSGIAVLFFGKRCFVCKRKN